MLADELKKLSRSEKLLLIHDLWDDLVQEEDTSGMRAEMVQELDARYQAFLRNPDEGTSWEAFRSKFQQ